MDIMQERALLAESRAKKRAYDADFDNPVITKPSPFLTIRDIVSRYSRGELVSVPEKVFETPVYSDEVEHIEPYKSDLEIHQRVTDFKDEYEKAKENYASSDKSSHLQPGTETPTDGVAKGNDSSVGE